MGDVVSDLNRRRGIVLDIGEKYNVKIIKASVPLSEMFGYATNIRSISQGRALFSMEFFKYNEVPFNVSNEIISKRTFKSSCNKRE
jgi:elongation factor G